MFLATRRENRAGPNLQDRAALVSSPADGRMRPSLREHLAEKSRYLHCAVACAPASVGMTVLLLAAVAFISETPSAFVSFFLCGWLKTTGFG
jgi:hypothetical protein